MRIRPALVLALLPMLAGCSGSSSPGAEGDSCRVDSGSFVAGDSYPTGGGAMGITTADLNGDGMLDLAVSNSTGDTMSVQIGKGVCQ